MHWHYLSLQKRTKLLILKELAIRCCLDLWIFGFPIIQELVMTIIKDKTGSFEVNFSEETLKVKKSVDRKLMVGESHGKVIGLGTSVTTKDLRAEHPKSEYKLLVKVLNKVLTMQNQIGVLTAKVAAQATKSQPESVHSTLNYVFNLRNFAFFLSNVHELCV